jgi:hypothetical protein
MDYMPAPNSREQRSSRGADLVSQGTKTDWRLARSKDLCLLSWRAYLSLGLGQGRQILVGKIGPSAAHSRTRSPGSASNTANATRLISSTGGGKAGDAPESSPFFADYLATPAEADARPPQTPRQQAQRSIPVPVQDRGRPAGGRA